ncbi:ubiquinol-cytochrome-c reductase complex assembly factor 1 [Orussus abietinus]|uniref:ubiquinol-cytochrome-c reductase complex assembly factor 1 n=1 Tax=Orussus abietinus TaxID=222816 RepID=UPI00062505CC|nr:ubiquinol-cytochrome-c reductase complex assembly factor 1 [Orussus abietinus]
MMRRFQVSTLIRVPQVVTSNISTCWIKSIDSELETPAFALPHGSSRFFHLSRPQCISIARKIVYQPNIFARTKQKVVNFFDVKRYRQKLSTYFLYEQIADEIDYSEFFEEFKMADTFNSWFLITELHVWMIMSRFMAEGELGIFLRNSIVQAMWEDVNIRTKKLKDANQTSLRKQVKETSQQFNAAIIGYDEGLFSDDKVLAGALWRRFFALETNNPEHIEKLVMYTRKQMNMLDKIPLETILKQHRVPWIPLKNC